MLVTLAGGVGAARFLRGLVDVVPRDQIVVIGNTGDDDTFHGLHVSPDLDTVVYTLAGAIHPEQGWGLAGETFRVMEHLRRYGNDTWFNLGDRDLATHLFRSQALHRGVALSTVTQSIANAWKLGLRIIPMSDDPVRTRITTIDGRDLSMQEWFVRERSDPAVSDVRFVGASRAQPAPGVLDAIQAAEKIVICPSNPILSIGPLLGIPALRDALVARRDHVVAVSPIIAGKTIKGPADRVMAALGFDPSCVGVARAYTEVCSTLVIDDQDADRQRAAEEFVDRVVVTDTIMRDERVAAALARYTLDAVA